MESMKFLMTNSFYPPYHLGGDANHVYYLGKSLVKEGHEVHVFHSLDAFNLKCSKKIEKEDNNENDGIIVHTLKSPIGKAESVFNYTFGSFPHTLNHFRKLVKKENFDVINHHNIALLGYRILEKIGTYKQFYTAHDYWLICQIGGFTKNYNILCTKKTCFSCALKYKRPVQIFRYGKKFSNIIKNDIDKIITPSNYMRSKLKEELKNEIVFVANSVPKPTKEREKVKYDNYFLYAGALEERKGVRDLLSVFGDYKIKSKLLVVGRGNLEGYVKKFVSKNNLENRIIFGGWAEKSMLYSLYEKSLALILPSTYGENAPLTILEGLSVGTPTIGSDIGGIPEIVRKMGSKLLFKPNDKEDMKEKILNFDKSRYPKEKIKKIYEKYYSQEIHVKNYFSKVING